MVAANRFPSRSPHPGGGRVGVEGYVRGAGGVAGLQPSATGPLPVSDRPARSWGRIVRMVVRLALSLAVGVVVWGLFRSHDRGPAGPVGGVVGFLVTLSGLLPAALRCLWRFFRTILLFLAL